MTPAKKTFKSTTYRRRVGCGNLYATIKEDKGTIAKIGKAGGCESAWVEGVWRLISLCAEFNVPQERVASELMGISCHKPYEEDGRKNLSCVDAIGQILKEDATPAQEKDDS